MSFVRPEVRDALRRWREALAGVVALALGLWWGVAGHGLLAWLGLALALAGLALALAGWQRGRFRQGGGGPGMVQLDEGRLIYFGPLTGGAVAVRDIRAVALEPQSRPPHWVLESADGALYVPVNAEGADLLFDVFAPLEGLDTGAVRAALAQPPARRTTLWRAPAPRLGRARPPD